MPPPDLLLQRFAVDRPTDIRGLYWHAFPTRPSIDGASTHRVEIVGTTLLVPPNTTLSFDNYFNAFYEAQWRRHTRLGVLLLRVVVEGACTLRVLRRAVGGHRMVHERVLDSGGCVTIALPDGAISFRQYGMLTLELLTADTPATFVEASWLAQEADVEADVGPVGLSPVFCTFNREADIGRVLASIAADPVVMRRLARVFVINQGRAGLAKSPAVRAAADRLGGRLRIVQQANYGGAGGFGRGLLEALDDAATTHTVLLDDDITLEPDSLLRMASFFALAKSPIVVGGHMLDAVQPTTLYEAGAVISDRHWAFQPQHHSRNLLDHGVLDALSHPNPVHYNGWWCCGFPLSLVRQHGMPLPCFIRGDDLEYGLRLHQAGIETVSMPGVAVWHEPFYLKIGSWHLYYETRNMLIAASLHQPMDRWEVVRRMGRQLAMNLLTFRYYNAALILRGITDYLAGPAILRGSPQAVHAGLAAVRQQYPARATGRGVVLERQRLARPPRSTAAYLFTLVRLALGNAIVPTRDAPARLLPVTDLAWPTMRGVDHVAVETWWDEELPTFQRSRETFRRLAPEAMRVLLRLYRLVPHQAQRWQAAMPELTSEAFWRRYLGLADQRSTGLASLLDQHGMHPEPWDRAGPPTETLQQAGR